ncbi:MAG: Arm DNA-binding domain-containing protein, partial [Nitrosomonadaceae bacterium]
MAKIKLLTTRQINTLSAGFHSDGGNLYLRVRDTGSRSWVFRYKRREKRDDKVLDKVIEIGLGAVASRTLSQAREIAGSMRSAIINGRDPVTLVRVRRDGTVMTFRDCALALL